MGIYRYLLACGVVAEHLSGNIPSLTHTGMFAVVGFYVLSGYLITRVLNDVYGFRFAPFWSNRILRLYLRSGGGARRRTGYVAVRGPVLSQSIVPMPGRPRTRVDDALALPKIR